MPQLANGDAAEGEPMLSPNILSCSMAFRHSTVSCSSLSDALIACKINILSVLKPPAFEPLIDERLDLGPGDSNRHRRSPCSLSPGMHRKPARPRAGSYRFPLTVCQEPVLVGEVPLQVTSSRVGASCASSAAPVKLRLLRFPRQSCNSLPYGTKRTQSLKPKSPR